MKKLELPVTIHLARKDEVPNTSEILQNILEGENANIVEGYKILPNTSQELPFTFFSEINIDNCNLWSLFKALLLSLPQQVCFIYGHIDSKPIYSLYKDKFSLLNNIQPYSKELSQDGFLEFGVLFQDEATLNEVFVKKGKYIQFWGTNMESFIRVMNEHSLYEIEDLNFIDEYPVATESLSLYDSNVLRTEDLITVLSRQLQ
jgi:hypothetical protein